MGTVTGPDGKRAVLWRDGAAEFLTESIGGRRWTLDTAIDVNTRGQIIATGTDSSTGATVLVLLDPTR